MFNIGTGFVFSLHKGFCKCSTIDLLCFADDTTAYMSGPNDLTAEVNVQLKKHMIGSVVINSH